MSNSTSASIVSPDDTLCIPKRRRLTHALESDASGESVLYLYYGTKEVVFDEPEFIPFGQQLLLHDRFVAKAATEWAPRGAYPWDKVRDILEVLIEEGIVARFSEDVGPGAPRDEGKTNPLDPPPGGPAEHCMKHVVDRRFDESWPHVTRQLLGSEISLDYLEFFVPVFLVATSALDEEHRQLGEANIGPPELRFPVPTEWRTCPYAGSRYLDDRPMNVSALKIMNNHWNVLLRIAEAMRRDFVRRRGISGPVMTLGDMYLFACTTSSLPAYLMLRKERATLNGQVPSVLASLLRVMFGIRMTSQHMLSMLEQTRDWCEPVDRDEFLHITDRDCLYLGRAGVCAGPQGKMEEIVDLLCVGNSRIEPADFAEWIGEPNELDDFHSYVARGISVYAVTATFGIESEQVNERLLDVLARAGELPPDLERLREQAQQAADRTDRLVGRGSTAARRQFHVRLFAELHQVNEAYGGGTPQSGFFGVIDHQAATKHAQSLTELLVRTAPVRAWPAGVLAALVELFVDYLFTERQALRMIEYQQARVNAIIGRPTELVPLTSDDLALRGRISDRARLSDQWFQALGLSAHSCANRSRITAADGVQLVLE